MKKIALLAIVALSAATPGCSKKAAGAVESLTLGAGTNNIPIMVPVMETTTVTNYTQRPATLKIVNDAARGTSSARIEDQTRAASTFQH